MYRQDTLLKDCIFDNGEEVEVVWVNVKDITKMSTDMKTILAVTYFQDKK